MKAAIGLIMLASVLTSQTPQNDKRLVFSTYQGGDRNDDAQSVAVDPLGNIYVTGETESRDLQATPVGGKPLTAAVFKGYLTKYGPGGKEVLWRALIGGSSNTVPHAVALDRDGSAFVAGTTGARDLPLVNPVQDKQTGLNICFLMKFSPEGRLLFSTYFGGDRNEEALAMAIDSRGSVYVGGRATSTNLPVKNAIQPVIGGGGQDGFIVKFTPSLQVEYATYLGGSSGTDKVLAMAVGPDDSIFVTGETMSPDMATENAWIKQPQSYSSYVAKLTPEGKIAYFTYLGHRSGYSVAQAIAVDSSGRAYVVGHTTAKQMPVTEDAIQPAYAGGFRDAFLVRLTSDGSAADYLTYLGGSFNGGKDPDETAAAVAVDQRGLVYVSGETSSPDFPGHRPLQGRYGGVQDAYVIRIDIAKKQIVSSTFWGGVKRDAALALALGPGEVVTVAGESYSEDLPLSNAVQIKLGSTNDSFLMQMCEPWLRAYPGALNIAYTLGGDKPQPIDVEVLTGCPQKFDVSAMAFNQPWLTVHVDSRTVPAKLKLNVNMDGLVAGEYRGTLRVTVAEAFHTTLEIPVVLSVADPPAPAID